MKSVAQRALIVLGAALALGAVNLAVIGKEHIRRSGEIVYLPLAPVDPRSLVQGDYLALRFELAGELERRDQSAGHDEREGEVAYAPLALDDRRVASLSGEAAPAAMKLRYRIRAGHVWLGTNAFFFEEGTADRFRGARYGEFRVDRGTGEAVLVGLRGAGLEAM